jgi:hypothetical protein
MGKWTDAPLWERTKSNGYVNVWALYFEAVTNFQGGVNLRAGRFFVVVLLLVTIHSVQASRRGRPVRTGPNHIHGNMVVNRELKYRAGAVKEDARDKYPISSQRTSEASGKYDGGRAQH